MQSKFFKYASYISLHPSHRDFQFCSIRTTLVLITKLVVFVIHKSFVYHFSFSFRFLYFTCYLFDYFLLQYCTFIPFSLLFSAVPTQAYSQEFN